MNRFKTIVLSLLLLIAATSVAEGQVRDSILRKRSALDYQLQSRPRLPHFPQKMQFEQFFSISQYLSYTLPQGVTAGVDMCKFITPLFGLRAGLNIGNSFHVKMDGLIDLGAFGWYFDPDRTFTIMALAGIDGAFYEKRGTQEFRFAYGAHVGLSFDLRISNTLHFFIEPSATLYSNNYNNIKDWYIADPVAEFHVGINYRRPMVTQKFYQRLRGANRWFLSLGAGVQSFPLSTIGTKINSFAKSCGACTALGVGYWITPLSGIRVNFSYGVSPVRMEEEARQFATLAGVSLDYMYHLSNGENHQNTFSWSVIAGANYSYAAITRRYDPTEEIHNVGFNSGVNLCYNVNPSISIYVEPKATMFGIAQDSSNTGKVMLNLNGGLIFRW